MRRHNRAQHRPVALNILYHIEENAQSSQYDYDDAACCLLQLEALGMPF